MASENTETNAGNDEETGPPSETNEHDYAHSAANNTFASTDASSFSGTPAADGGVPAQGSFTAAAGAEQSGSGQPTISVELPEPAVGAEVDCPGGNDVEASSLPQTPAASDLADAAAAASSPGVSRSGRRRSMRPEDRHCSCCKSEFERQGRSFNRRAVFTFTTPETVQWAFPGATVNEKSFLCEICAQVIRSKCKCKRKQSGKRVMWLKPPALKPSEIRDKKKKGRRMGKKSKAAELVSKSCYKAAFKMLWSAKGARKPMMDFWVKQLKEEMKMLTRQTDSPFHQKVSSRRPLSSFPWRRCLNWFQDKAPLVTTCLTSLFPDISHLSKSSHQMSEEQAQTLLERRVVVALSIPLFTRNIWKNNYLQAALGAELRLQGCSGSALDALNTMGLCQNKDTVRLLLQRLRNGKKNATQNGQQRMKIKQEQMKREHMTDMDDEEEEDEEDENEEEAEEEVDLEMEEEEDEEEDEEEEEDDDDEEEEEEEEEELEMAAEEEQEEEIVDGVQQEEVEEVQAAEEKKRRRKKAKKQRKEEKRKERGKRKVKETEEEEEEEGDEGSEEKKRRVVVVRLGLLKGHSEVGRSDLSAP